MLRTENFLNKQSDNSVAAYEHVECLHTEIQPLTIDYSEKSIDSKKEHANPLFTASCKILWFSFFLHLPLVQKQGGREAEQNQYWVGMLSLTWKRYQGDISALYDITNV